MVVHSTYMCDIRPRVLLELNTLAIMDIFMDISWIYLADVIILHKTSSKLYFG